MTQNVYNNDLTYIKYKLQKYYNKLESNSDNKDIYEQKIKYYMKLLEGGGLIITQQENHLFVENYILYRDKKYNNFLNKSKYKNIPKIDNTVNIEIFGTIHIKKKINPITSINIYGFRYYSIVKETINNIDTYFSTIESRMLTIRNNSKIPLCIKMDDYSELTNEPKCNSTNSTNLKYITINNITFNSKEIDISFSDNKNDTLPLYDFINKYNKHLEDVSPPQGTREYIFKMPIPSPQEEKQKYSHSHSTQHSQHSPHSRQLSVINSPYDWVNQLPA
jgi:hypothetical protein